MGLTGPVGGPPVRVGAPVADYVGSLQTMIAVTLALQERTRSGRGQRVKVSLLEGQVAMLSNYVAASSSPASPTARSVTTTPSSCPTSPMTPRTGRSSWPA